MRSILLSFTCLSLALNSFASRIFVPMDADGQTNHLKAYGIAYAAMLQGTKVDWLLNYKGGSYGMDDSKSLEQLCRQRGVSFTVMTENEYAQVVREVSSPAFNGQVVKLEKAPKIAVYTPLNKEPWDDAVTLALTYAEIPFDKLYADEVLAGDLDKYDWLHLHHEDFTGQYGKFWMGFKDSAWYINDQKTMEGLAMKHGFKKVSQLQLAVVKKIKDFVGSGGNMFAMCSATETFDIALAANGTDIVPAQFDGDAMDPDAQKKLDFNNCLAFKDFHLTDNAYSHSHSDIDNLPFRHMPEQMDNFTIVSPPGKMDAVPVMLCQNHARTIHGFMGKTTSFRKNVIKPNVMILGDRLMEGAEKSTNAAVWNNTHYDQNYEARYIHGEYGKGSWTFLGGHDPEDYQHRVGASPTDLKSYPNSPGYRLILNNVLFPAVKKSDAPTVVMGQASRKEDGGSETAAVKVEKTLKLFPNPTSNELLISLSLGKIQQVTILNIAGQEMISKSFDAAEVSVGMKELQPGMYMVKVNGDYVGKVVKE